MLKKRLKPILILALDPFAACFCAEVKSRLEREFGTRGSLIQTCALALDGGQFTFNFDLAAVGDARFDVQAARGESPGMTPQQAAQLFEENADKLQPALTQMLRAGRSFHDIEEAKREGVEVVDERVIYLVLSSVAPTAVGIVMEVARLIKWLYSTRFADELHTLHSLVLLPDLFTNCSSSDYACAYALLKRLDDAFNSHIEIMPHQNQLPFESCWLIDGRNARAIETRTLAENLAGYADAFVGFLGAEPERSGAILGRKARGRPPAYSSFGFSELYFPSETAIIRLSANLAGEITRLAFLGGGAPVHDSTRQLLVAAKQFVLSKSYTGTLQNLERYKGETIWRAFSPRAELREAATNEYVEELRRRHDEFEQGTQLEYRNALLESSATVCEELDALLDAEIDRLADASPHGLYDAAAYLNIMVDPYVALHKHLLGEDPENLMTALRSVEGTLDNRLGVSVDRQQTETLLEQIQDLRSQLESLQRDFRLLRIDETQVDAARQPAAERPAHSGEGSGEEQEVREPSQPEQLREQLSREIKETEQQLQNVSDSYRHAIDAEDRSADALRHDAKKRALVEKQERIAQAETELVNTGRQLGESKRELNGLLEEKHRFLRRHLIVHPSLLILVVFGLLLLAAVGDIGPARNVVAFLWADLFQVIIWLVLAALVYAGVIFWIFARNLNVRLTQARDRVSMLSSQLSAAAAQLRRTHNDQLLFKYEIFLQQMRADTVTRSIETAGHRGQGLQDKITALQQISASFDRTRAEAVPPSSVMRRPLLQAADIDDYYRKRIQSAGAVAAEFSHNHVQRSQVRLRSADEISAKILTFSLGYFNHLADLSIEDALLHQADLVTPETRDQRMRELNDAAQPLLRLRQTDASGAGMFAQQDTTLWVSGEERERLHELFRRVCPEATLRAGDNDKVLRVLTRSLNFPAYFTGAIGYYRDCYEREPNKDATDLPDVLPVNDRVSRAHERLLLALAVGLIKRDANGCYVFSNGSNESFGTDRKQIAERLATNFASQKLHREFETRLTEQLSEEKSIYQKLTEFINSTTDLEPSERLMLVALANRYF